MTPETGFLEAIQQDPCDPTPRLIYADWLEEQGRDEEAEWLRLDAKVDQSAFVDPRDLHRLMRMPKPKGVYPLYIEKPSMRRRAENKRFWTSLEEIMS